MFLLIHGVVLPISPLGRFNQSANPTKKLRQDLADFGPNIFLSAIEWSGKFARISLRLRGHQEERTRGGRNILNPPRF